VGASRRDATNVASTTQEGAETTFVTATTNVVSMGQEPIETTLVAAGALRTHS
jgi:hypothetical protein